MTSATFEKITNEPVLDMTKYIAKALTSAVRSNPSSKNFTTLRMFNFFTSTNSSLIYVGFLVGVAALAVIYFSLAQNNRRSVISKIVNDSISWVFIIALATKILHNLRVMSNVGELVSNNQSTFNTIIMYGKLTLLLEVCVLLVVNYMVNLFRLFSARTYNIVGKYVLNVVFFVILIVSVYIMCTHINIGSLALIREEVNTMVVSFLFILGTLNLASMITILI